MATEHVEYHSVPEIVINRDGPEERRIAFVDDFGGTMQLSTQQLRANAVSPEGASVYPVGSHYLVVNLNGRGPFPPVAAITG